MQSKKTKTRKILWKVWHLICTSKILMLKKLPNFWINTLENLIPKIVQMKNTLQYTTKLVKRTKFKILQTI